MKYRIGLVTMLFAFHVSGFTVGEPVAVQDTSPFIDQQDIEALRDWIATKRQVTVKQLGGDLSLSGEVRTEVQASSETQGGIQQRGMNGVFPNKPTTAFDVEVNLMLDYRAESNWASIKIEFDNDAGNNLNVFDNVSIERAFYGFRVVNKDTFTTDLELGRRNFGTVFDSRVQFGSFMDGVLLRMDLASDKYGDVYLRGAPFLINEKRNQYGWVGELGILNIFDTGFYAKYSLIDWDTKDLNDPILNQLYRFFNGQVTAGYKFVPKFLNKMVTVYAAYLRNYAAQPVVQTLYKKDNNAWYAGVSIGKVRKKGDWSLDVNYQYVQSQSVASFDASGIGKGNAANVGFYTINMNGSGGITTVDTAFGRTNYKGLAAEFLFLFSDTITILQSYQFSNSADKTIGPSTHYSQYEAEIIYAF